MKRRRRYARGGRTRGRRGMFLGGLFGAGSASGPSGFSNTSSNNTTKTEIDPGGNYYPLQQSILGFGQNLLNRPYEGYDPNQRFADFTPDQQQAFQNIRNNQGNWQPAFNAGQANLYSAAGQAGGVGTAGQPAFDQALNAPTGSEAAQPYLQGGTKAWTDPGVASSYMSPYLDTAAQGITNTATRNFMQNVLPGINDTFTGGNAGQFGRERHSNATTNAVTAFGEGLTNQLGQLYNQGYQFGQSAFGADQNRQLTAGQTAGQLGVSDVNARTNLGTALVGQGTAGVNAGINAGNALINSGTTQQQNAAKDSSLLLASGQQQQTQAQKLADFNYQQFLQKQNWGVNNAQLAQGLAQGWQLPTTSSSQSQSWGGTGSVQPTGSIAGNVLGAASTIAGMGTGGGNTVGGDIWNSIWGNNTVPGSDVPGNGTVNVKTGGRITNRRAFAAGGFAPVVKAMRQSAQKRLPAQQQRQQAFQQRQQGPMAGAPPQGPKPAFQRGGKVGVKAAVHKHERVMHGAKKSELTKLAGGGKVNGAFSPMPRRGFAYAEGGSTKKPRYSTWDKFSPSYRLGPNWKENAYNAAADIASNVVDNATAFGQRELEGARRWFTDPVETAREVLPNYLPQHWLPKGIDMAYDMMTKPAFNVAERYADPRNYTRDPLSAALSTAGDLSNYLPGRAGAFTR